MVYSVKKALLKLLPQHETVAAVLDSYYSFVHSLMHFTGSASETRTVYRGLGEALGETTAKRNSQQMPTSGNALSLGEDHW